MSISVWWSDIDDNISVNAADGRGCNLQDTARWIDRMEGH